MKEIKHGDAVMIKRTGRIGMAHSFDPSGAFLVVQLGADGPFILRLYTSVRHATLREVKAAGMYGVGFNIVGEGEQT